MKAFRHCWLSIGLASTPMASTRHRHRAPARCVLAGEAPSPSPGQATWTPGDQHLIDSRRAPKDASEAGYRRPDAQFSAPWSVSGSRNLARLLERVARFIRSCRRTDASRQPVGRRVPLPINDAANAGRGYSAGAFAPSLATAVPGWRQDALSLRISGYRQSPPPPAAGSSIFGACRWDRMADDHARTHHRGGRHDARPSDAPRHPRSARADQAGRGLVRSSAADQGAGAEATCPAPSPP